jgi:hypothetical protein
LGLKKCKEVLKEGGFVYDDGWWILWDRRNESSIVRLPAEIEIGRKEMCLCTVIWDKIGMKVIVPD